MSQNGLKLGSLEHCVEMFREDYGMVIGNPSQIYWHEDHHTAMTQHQFLCAGKRKRDAKSRIRESSSPEEHIAYVLNHFVESPASITFLAVGWSGYALLQYLNQNWDEWKDRDVVIVLMVSSHSASVATRDDFREFLKEVCLSRNTNSAMRQLHPSRRPSKGYYRGRSIRMSRAERRHRNSRICASDQHLRCKGVHPKRA